MSTEIIAALGVSNQVAEALASNPEFQALLDNVVRIKNQAVKAVKVTDANWGLANSILTLLEKENKAGVEFNVPGLMARLQEEYEFPNLNAKSIVASLNYIRSNYFTVRVGDASFRNGFNYKGNGIWYYENRSYVIPESKWVLPAVAN